MTYRVTVVTPAATAPLTLSDVKTFLRVTHNDDDDALEHMIDAATDMAERYTGRSFIRKTLCLYDRGSRPDAIRLPAAPVLSVDQVSAYSRTNDTETVIDPAQYIFSPAFSCVRLKYHPLADEMRVIFTAGYGNTGDSVPEPLLEGMRLHIEQLYNRPEKGSDIPTGAKYRYNSYRMPRIF